MKNFNENFFRMGKFLAIFLFMGAVIASCSKDKDEDNVVNRADFEHNFFNIGDGDFSGKALPGSNSQSLQILSVSGNETILAGGSNLIRITGSDNARQVIAGVRDQNGYFTVPMTAGESVIDLRLLIGQGVSNSFTIALAVSDGQGNVSAYEYLVVTLMNAGTGLLQVSLSWDQLNDVDLHVIEPNGTEIYYGNDSSANGGVLDVDSNAGCGIDGINNENIYYEDSPEVTIENGEYEVLVDLWSNCNIVGNTNYTVVVYYGGEIIATTQGSNPYSGVFTPEDESGNTNLTSVMKFNINGAPKSSGTQNQMSIQKTVKFGFDKNNKVFENFSIKK